MARKSSKKPASHLPAPGTPEHAAWRKSISTGMAKAKKRRRSRGLWSQMEVSVHHGLPMRFVRSAIKAGKLRALQIGQRTYVRVEDAEAAFGKRVA